MTTHEEAGAGRERRAGLGRGPNPALLRQAEERALADQQWQTVQEEDRQNEALLDLSHEILELTKAIHVIAAGSVDGRRGSDVAAGSANVRRTSTKEKR